MLCADSEGLMKKQGEAPGGNVEAEGFPTLPRASRDLLARVVANLDGGLKLARGEAGFSRLPDTDSSHVWRVKSQVGNRHYMVTLSKDAVKSLNGTLAETPAQARIRCPCAGGAVLVQQGADRVCTHCCAVLVRCMASKPPGPLAITSGASSSSSPKGVRLALLDRDEELSGGRAPTKPILKEAEGEKAKAQRPA